MTRAAILQSGLLIRRPRLRAGIAIAAGLLLASCGQTSSTPGSLQKPALVAVGAFEIAPDIAIADPGFAARISQRMSGLTDYSIRQATAKRAGATIRQQLVASLRAGGLPAEAADTDNARGDIVTLLVTGTLKSLDEATLRQRKLAPIGPARSRVVADLKVVHATTGLDTKTVLNFQAEDTAAGGGAPARGGRQAPVASLPGPAGAAPEPLSPDIDAHMRRVANAAADRILGLAAEQGWTKTPAVAGIPR